MPSQAAVMSAAPPVRVLVVDDHAGVRLGIAALVDAERPRMACVGVAASAAEALARTRALQPAVVVLDVDLAGEDGLLLVAPLRSAAPCVVVVLTSLTAPAVARRARERGAQACLNKTAPAGDLLEAIAAAAASLTTEGNPAPANEGSAMSCAGRDQSSIGPGRLL